MGKVNKCLIVGGLLITILSTYICYSNGWTSGFTDSCKLAGYTEGYYEAASEPDETAFVDGCNSGIQEIVRSVCNPHSEYQSFRKITFHELITFLKSDKTDEIEYSDNFTCSGHALALKRNANSQGIACAFVVLNYKDNATGKTDTGHTINAFDIDGGQLPKIDGVEKVTFHDGYCELSGSRFLPRGNVFPLIKPGTSPPNGFTPSESTILMNYINKSGIVYVEPQSDEIVYGVTKYSSYSLLTRDYINESGNIIHIYYSTNTRIKGSFEDYLWQQLISTRHDIITNVELIW